MIENFDKSSEYTQKLFKIDDDIILEIEEESLKDKVPIITREVLNFMLFEAERIKAKNILEIGTATGFSGIFLAQIANRNSGKLTTIEIDEVRYKKAKENFKKLGLLEKNELEHYRVASSNLIFDIILCQGEEIQVNIDEVEDSELD